MAAGTGVTSSEGRVRPFFSEGPSNKCSFSKI